ncbi:MAG: hypothetical protein QNJ03_04225 [Dinoroseobacter sp.]|nr:hypothetical protein [Dinoroseobacter sp.]
MADALRTNSSIEGLSPLGTPPQRSYELITGTVRTQLSEAHSALFAEPVATQFGDRFDWYPAIEGKARAFSQLDEAEQAAVQSRLETLSHDIREIANTYASSDLAEEQRLGEALSNALSYPGSEWVYAVETAPGDLQPVLVNWAWVSDRQATVTGTLTAPDTRPTPKSAGAETEPGRASASPTAVARQEPRVLPIWLFWLGWLILALLLAAILWLLVPACGLRTPFFISHCATQAEASEEHRRTAKLQNQIAALEREIGIMDRSCQPDPMRQAVIPPFPAQTLPAALPDIDARREQAGAELGDLTITLAWDTTDDMDLYVTCPAGVTVWHQQRLACNGQLDVDSNVGAPAPEPVENTFFTDPLAGTYSVRVNLYASRTGGGETPFTVQIRSGDRVENLTGIVSGQSRDWTHSFTFGGQ